MTGSGSAVFGLLKINLPHKAVRQVSAKDIKKCLLLLLNNAFSHIRN